MSSWFAFAYLEQKHSISEIPEAWTVKTQICLQRKNMCVCVYIFYLFCILYFLCIFGKLTVVFFFPFNNKKDSM